MTRGAVILGAATFALSSLSCAPADDRPQSRTPAKADCRNQSAQGEIALGKLAACLASIGGSISAWTIADSPPERVLYVDLSGSMRGFLDPRYRNDDSAHFRTILDRVIAGLQPVRAYGYGSSIISIRPSLGTLADRQLYNQGKTRLELALDSVEVDVAAKRTHVIVGDGRQDRPQDAYGQFARMREVARSWARAGGTFFVAATAAPFVNVEGDPAACHTGAASPNEGRCPFYAFAFAAAGDGWRTGELLAGAFQFLFAWPANGFAPGDIVLESEQGQQSIGWDSRWTPLPSGGTVARTRSAAATSSALSIRVRPAPSGVGHTRLTKALLAGDAWTSAVDVAAVEPSASPRWASTPLGLIRPDTADALRFSVYTRGPGTRLQLYRITLSADGTPSWLDRFDSKTATDPSRTFGLSRLFEGFQVEHGTPDAAAGVFFVLAN